MKTKIILIIAIILLLGANVFSQTISLSNAQCNSNILYGKPIISEKIETAELYEFHIYRENFSKHIVSTTGELLYDEYKSLPLFKTLNVEIRYYADGIWSEYGNTCRIKIITDSGFDEMYAEYSQTHTPIEWKPDTNNREDESDTIFFPVVFHVIIPPNYYGTPYDYLPPVKINECLHILNSIFSKKNSNDLDHVDTKIRFCPAKKDINGFPLLCRYMDADYYGITYNSLYGNDVYLPEGISAYPFSIQSIQQENFEYYTYFPRDKYLNIWIFDSLGYDINGLGWSDCFENGLGFCAIDKDVVGVNNVRNRELGYVIAHEMGHFLGLLHTWNDTTIIENSNGDYITDTHEHNYPSVDCSECDTIPVHNMMNYSPDGCRRGFTEGQKNRMWNVINQYYSFLRNSNVETECRYPIDIVESQIICPIENYICAGTSNVVLYVPDTSIFQKMRIYKDNIFVGEYVKNNFTCNSHDTITLANYQFLGPAEYRFDIYSGHNSTNTIIYSRTYQIVECNDLTENMDKSQWYFDKNICLDFTHGLPQISESNMDATASESSVCNSNGTILFYTDGKNIWNGNHVLQSDTLETASNKGTIILKFSEYKYAIVTLTTGNILKSKVIDIVNNNLTIRETTTIYQDNELYGLTAIPSTDGKYWLLSSVKINSIYSPIIMKVNLGGNNLSIICEQTNIINYEFGAQRCTSIKSSPDSKFVVFGIYNNGYRLMRFNAKTGILKATSCTIQSSAKNPSMAFSPNGRFLYVVTGTPVLEQIDLKNYNNCSCNIESKIIFDKTNEYDEYSEYFKTQINLQEGPDGKIYISRDSREVFSNSRMLGVISEPNIKANANINDNECSIIEHLIDYPIRSVWCNRENLPNFVDAKIDTCMLEMSICSQNCNPNYLQIENLSLGSSYTWIFKDTLGEVLSTQYTYEPTIPLDYINNIDKFVVELTSNGCNISITDTVNFNPRFSIGGDSIVCLDNRDYYYEIHPDVTTQNVEWHCDAGYRYGSNISYNSSHFVNMNSPIVLSCSITDRLGCNSIHTMNIRLDSIRYSISTPNDYCNELNQGMAIFTLNSQNSAPYNLDIEDVNNITNSIVLQHPFRDLQQGTYNYTLSNNVCSYSRHFTIEDELTGFNCTIIPQCSTVNVSVWKENEQDVSGYIFDFYRGNTLVSTISNSSVCDFEVDIYDENADIFIPLRETEMPIRIKVTDISTNCEHFIDTTLFMLPHVEILPSPRKPIYCEGDTGYAYINIYGFSDTAMIGFNPGVCNIQFVETGPEGYFTYQVKSPSENQSIVVLDRNYERCVIFKDVIPIPKVDLAFETVDSVAVICEEGGTTDIYVNITIDPPYNILHDSVHWNTDTATYLEQTGSNTFRTVLPNVHAGTYEYSIQYTSGCTYEGSITIEESPHVTIIEISRYIDAAGNWWICPVYSTRMYFGYTLEIYDSEETLVFQRNNVFLGMYMCYAPFSDGIYTAKLIDPCGCYTTYQFVLERDELVIDNARLADVTCKTSYSTSATFDIYGSQTPYTVQIISSGITLASRTYNRAGTYTIYFTAPTIGGNIDILATSADNTTDVEHLTLNMVCNNTALTSSTLQSSYNGQTIVVANETNGLYFNRDVNFVNCTIYCAYDNYSNMSETKWTVPKGKYLYMEGTTIKSGCSDKMWQGIKVYGDSTRNHNANNITYHGRIVVSNSTIEDAMYAIDSYDGGVATALFSNFNNNRYDIYLHKYQYEHTVDLASLIAGNSFSTTRLLNSPTTFPTAHICLDNVMGVIIGLNSFQNTVPHNYQYAVLSLRESDLLNRPISGTYYTSNRGIGIKSTLSSFTTNSATVGTNTFDGLYYGIYANGQKQNPISLYGNRMTDNFRGIYLANNNGANVKYNKISVSEGPFSFVSNEQPSNNNGVPSGTVPYGIYLNGCSGYSVQYDTITKGITGMYVRNSGSEALQIKNCIFGESSSTGSTNAIIVSGTNSNYSTGNGSVGLQILCNDFTGNTNDIGVINGNMGSGQGFANGNEYLPTGNQFNIASPSTMEFRTQFQNNFLGNYTSFDIGPYTYYQHDDGYNNIQNGFDRELEQGRYTEVVLNGNGGVFPYTKQGIGYSQSYCQSRNTTCTELLSEINGYDDNLEKLEADYANRLDGGNTQSLLADIRTNSVSANYDLNGFMSDECFYAIIDEIENNPSYYVPILIENSPLPEYIYQIAMSKNIPEIYKNTLALYQIGENSRLVAEREISALRQSISYNESMLMNQALNNDSVPSERLMALAYFGDKNDLQSKINVYRLNCVNGNYMVALANLSDIGSNASTDNYEISTFCEVNRMYIGIMTNLSRSSLDTSFLHSAVDDDNYLYSSLAQVLYEYATDSITEHYTPLFIDEVQPRFLKADESENPSFFNIYPNPTRGIVNIEFNANKDENLMSFCEKYGVSTIHNCTEIKIEVFDINSRLIMTMNRSLQEPIQVDLSEYPPSDYTIRIKDCNNNLLVFKVVKI